MMNKIKSILYSGLTKEEYKQIEMIALQQNMRTLKWSSMLAAIMMFLLFLVTFFPNFSLLRENRHVYLSMYVVSFAVYVIDVVVIPKYSRYLECLFYFFLISVFVLSIYIGVVTNVDQRASTICVLLLAIPLLITDKPYRISILLVISAIAFCITSYLVKEYELFVSDSVNCLCILVMSIAVTIVQQNMRYKNMLEHYMIDQYHIQRIQKQEVELEESRIAIMLSQIQPHFLFNSLSVIQSLCMLDPEKAKSAIVDFSMFLRGNMDSIGCRELIPVQKELEHVNCYLKLQKLRFEERLNIEYEIQCKEFSLPALTIQPIVENAITHGLRQKRNGGTVWIKTYEDELYYYVEIKDDGIGLEVNDFQENVVDSDGRSHVGIVNVKKRLEEMANASFEIESQIGIGTSVRIAIPKEKVISK